MRVYATVGVWGIYGARELMRLMDWAPENRRRTAIWCTVSAKRVDMKFVWSKRLNKSFREPFRPTLSAQHFAWFFRLSSSSS